MKWTHVCPLLGVTLLACATGENDNPNPLGLGTGAENVGGSSETAGSGATATAGSGTGGSSSGSFAMGGSTAAGSTSGGTFGFSGTTSFAGTFGTSGASTAGAGGAGGTGGANGGGGAGGKPSGGAGGKAAGGGGGTAGAGGAMCGGQTVPAKTTWKGSGMPVDGAYPASKAFDDDNSTRFATGTKQVGGEWLEIDFGKIVTINEITLFTNNGDFFRHYQLRLSNTAGDFIAPVLKDADGVQGAIVIPLATAKAGRYLTIKQTGAVAAGEIAWWSLHEVSVACK